MSEEFEDIVGPNFSPAEMHMGQEAYQSQVEYNKKQSAFLDLQMEMLKKQVEHGDNTIGSSNRKDDGKANFYNALSLLLVVVIVILALVVVPLVVIAWRSAF
jgi:hypothetical protein